MKKIILYNWLSNISLELVIWMIYLKSIGWSVAEIALLESCYTISQAIFELPSGIVSDYLGHKRTLVLGEICCLVYLTSYFFARIHILMYLSYIIYALGLALISGTDVSLLYESLSSEEKTKYLKYSGYFNTAGVFAMAFGNAAGGWLANLSWITLFVCAMVIRAMALVTIISIHDPRKNDIVRENDNLFSVIKQLFEFVKQNKKFRVLALAMFTASACVTVSYQYGPLVLKQWGMATGFVSTLFGIISLLGACMTLFVYKLSKKLTENRLVILLLLICFVLFGTLMICNLYLFIFSLVVINVMFEMWNVVFENKIQQISSEGIRASLFSSINFCESLLLTLSSLIISLFDNNFSLNSIISLIGLIFIGLALIFFSVYQRSEEEL